MAIPAKFIPEEIYGHLFFGLGNGVYASLTTVNAIGLQNYLYAGENYLIYKWDFDSAQIGGTVLETGSDRDTSFAKFKKAIIERSVIAIDHSSKLNLCQTGSLYPQAYRIAF